MRRILLLSMPWLFVAGCNKDEPDVEAFELTSAFAGAIQIDLTGGITENIPIDRTITLNFSAELDESALEHGILLNAGDQSVEKTMTLLSGSKSVSISTLGPLIDHTVYTLSITDQFKTARGTAFKPMSFSFKTQANPLEIIAVSINGEEVGNALRIQNVPVDFSMIFDFSTAVNVASFQQAIQIPGVVLDIIPSNDDRTILLKSTAPLEYLKKYEVTLSDELLSSAGGTFDGFSAVFYTRIDPAPKFPHITDNELLTNIQERTFKYFWDFAHPVSGLVRERNTSGHLVTIGGSGFGVMSILVGIERGFITRQQGVDRLETIVNFLKNADRFHGVWPHWMNGSTGEVIPFNSDDNGGDLVETAFMIQGLLTVRQYLNDSNTQEAGIIDTITGLWQEVEWDWYTQGDQKALYWHWSPDFGWQKNLKISGWNESMIVYVLAAASPTHPVAADVYHEGWARSGAIRNGGNFFNIFLPLGADFGGPLFFSHYSFLGLDPRNLEDQYANYWTQNVNHSAINQAYCISNPKQYVGYAEDCWGLTASDNHEGYSAHSPNNDLGVISPTAAISSIPYTPDEAFDAIRHFYYLLGDKLWGEYGFYDAFNLTEEWIATSYLAIDQGPIILMIENYRSGLLWDTFMKDEEVRAGLDKLGFSSY